MAGVKMATAFAVALALASARVSADTIQKTFTFAEGDFDFSQKTEGETTYDVVEYDGGVLYDVPGEPRLPLVGYSFSIPYGSTVTDVEITASDSEIIDGSYYLYPGQEPIPAGPSYAGDDELCCEDIEWEFTPPDEAIYEFEDPFPADILNDNGSGATRGYLLADFGVFPLQYSNPAERELTLYTSITVRVTYTPPNTVPQAERYEWPHLYDLWADAVKATVVNPEDVEENREPVTYVDVMDYGVDVEGDEEIPWVAPAESEYYTDNIPDTIEGASDPNDMEYPYPFVIITNDKWWISENNYKPQPNIVSKLGPFAYWKIRKGFPLAVVPVDYIVANVEGDDKQDKIRNFLQFAHKKWDTIAVLLAGDTAKPTGKYEENWARWGRYGVVPSRYVCPNVGGPICSSDFYYACLEGSWGPYYEGGVGYYGCRELPGPVLKPSVMVGRVPVGDAGGGGNDGAETAKWVAKLIKYETDPPAGYLDKVLLIGSDFGVDDCQKLLDENYFPAFSDTEVYEGTGPSEPNADADYPTYPEPHDVLDAMNAGAGITVIQTHGHPLCHYILTHKNMRGDVGAYIQEFTVARDMALDYANRMMFATGQLEVATGGKYGLLFTTSCSTYKYAYRDAEDKESLGEEYLADGDGGGVAYIGNTGPTTIGSSQYIAKYFFEFLMNKTPAPGDDVFVIGLPHVFSLAKYCSGTPADPAYKCNLAGDPTMTAWTAEPADLTMSYDSWATNGGYTVEVEVFDDTPTAVEEAEVVLWVPDEYYLLGWTNEDGKVRFKVPGAFTGGMLTSWKHNYVPALADGVSVGGD